ncbi:alpha/beta hydrolase [Halomonas garicola]|uniref:alpha/beta hydrolase n=1 Tax=Halomonas garicola TaxID=1690008 RepID=UPI00289A2079|nr:alpha/beta hydrolase-fold protein [Halomonas garicola]
MHSSETFTRRAQSGAAHRISLWLPPGTPPAGGWPAVYVLDAGAMFATVAEAVKRSGRRPDATGVGMAAVVGIAPCEPNEEGERLAVASRYRDYTFEASRRVEVETSGGGAAFLAFIADELVPELTRDYGLSHHHRMLFGHSLAGYFVLNALAQRPCVFTHYAAISPSVWWHPEALAERLEGLDRASAEGISGVLVAVGEWEGEPAPWLAGSPTLESVMQRRRERQMIGRARATAAQLTQKLGERRVQWRCFSEEDHASIVMIGIQRSLRLMFGA